MEGRPRYNEERPDDDNDSETSADKRKKRKLRLPSLSSYLERPDADKSDAEKATEPSGWSDRYERIRNRKDTQPLLPEVQSLDIEAGADSDEEKEKEKEDNTDAEIPAVPEPVEYYETWSPAAVETIVGTTDPGAEDAKSEAAARVSDDDESEDIAPVARPLTESVPGTTESADEISPQRSSEAIPSQRPEGALAESGLPEPEQNLEQDLEQAAEQQPDGSAEQGPVPEPESIDAILRRHAPEIPERSTDGPTSPGEDEPEDGDQPPINPASPITLEGSEPSSITNNYIRNETKVYNESRNTGLHLLNYALARRRDTRDRNAANKKIDAVNERVDLLEEARKRQEAEIAMFEKQRREAAKTPKPETVFDRNKEVNRQNVAEKTIFDSHWNPNTIARESVVMTEQEVAPTPEMHPNTWEVANEQARAIVSERVYEQRHEAQDFTGQAASQSQGNSNAQAVPTGPSATLDRGDRADGQQSYADFAALDQRGPAKTTRKSDYTEAAVIGAWGAVVGIIVFIIFYMLTRG